jgi:hypothetical protein
MNATQKTIMNANPFSGLFELHVEAVVVGPVEFPEIALAAK